MINMPTLLSIHQSFCILWHKIFNISEFLLRPYSV